MKAHIYIFNHILKPQVGLMVGIFLVVGAVTLIMQKNYPLTKHALHEARGIISLALTMNNPVKIAMKKTDFSSKEVPSFGLSIPYKNTNKIGVAKKNTWENKNEQIMVEIKNKNSGKVHSAVITKGAAGKFILAMANPQDFDRGTFELKVSAKESFIYERDLSQDFTWGVVAVNTDKSVYAPGETAKLAFGVLNKYGNTICNAKIDITIGDPDKNEQTLSTKDGTIHNSSECGDNFSSIPDYFGEYQTGKSGRYFMHVTATTTSGSHSITDYFDVRDNIPFSIERLKFPTRIYPPSGYPVELKITANEDYEGKVYDTVPQSFQITEISGGGSVPLENRKVVIKTPSKEIVKNDLYAYKNIPKLSKLLWQDPSSIKSQDNHIPMPIVWNVNWKKGQTYTLSYTVNFPNISPEYYLLGPFIVGGNLDNTVDSSRDYSKAISMDNASLSQDPNIKFFEARQWQIASDATKCWKGTVNANWSTANNWVTTAGVNTSITSGDVAVFDSSTTTCSSNSTANNSTIDATFGGSVQGLKILTYAGTITQARSLTLTAATGFVQSAAGSTFTGATQAITTTLFNQTNGTFTSTSGILTDTGNFTSSGGSFNNNSGTVKFLLADGVSATFTGSITLNNLTLDNTNCCNSVHLTIASGTTVTVNGTLTLDQSTPSGRWDNYLSGTGGISAKGDITVLHTGWLGYGVITINGTGTQTLTGVVSPTISGDVDASMPSTVINKTSGTLNLVNTIAFSNDFTYIQGTINPGTSTVVFVVGTKSQAINEIATITGTVNLYNVQVFYNDCCNNRIFTVNTGTISAGGTLTWDGLGGGNDMVFAGSGRFDAQGDFTVTAGFVSGFAGTSTMPVQFSGSNATQTVTINASCCTRGILPDGTWTINKSSGSVVLATNLSLTNTGQDLIITSGTLNIAGFNLGVDDQFTLGSSGTLKLQGGETMATLDSVANGSTVEYTGSGTYSSLLAGSTYGNLIISGSGSFTPTSNVIVSGNFTQSAGTFNVAPSGMTVGGNFNRSGGSFTAGSSTVTFDSAATTSIISGSTTFYNFTSITPNKIIKFTNGTTTTVSNALTLRGNSSGLLTIASTTPASQWNLNANGSASLSNLSVQDSNACGGGVNPLIATSSLSVSNNSCWTITGGGTEWYDPRWTKRRAITIDHTQVAGDLTNFPILASLASDASLAANAQSTGNDILFTADDGTTKLSHELEKFDGATGQLAAWVKIPSLSSLVNTTIYMYYGNASAANQQDRVNVWDSNYKLVEHLSETSGTSIADSTSNNNTGAKLSVGNPASTTGIIAGAQNFTNDNITVAHNSSLNIVSAGTYSTWVKLTATGANVPLMFKNNTTDLTDMPYTCFILSNNQVSCSLGDQVTSSSVNSNTLINSTSNYYYITFTWDGANEKIYVNGALDNTAAQTVTPVSNSIAIYFGQYSSPGSLFYNGIMDEERLSNTNRSANWIQTEYNNQKTNSTFATFSTINSIPFTNIRGGVKFHGGTKIRGN